MEAVEHGARAGDVQATGTAAEVATEAAAASAAAAVEAAQAEAEEAEGEEEEEEEMNLLRYTALQHRVAQLQGMQACCGAGEQGAGLQAGQRRSAAGRAEVRRCCGSGSASTTYI